MGKSNIKFMGRLLFLVITFVFAISGHANAVKVEKFETGLQGGYRVDDLDWNIAADFSGSTPNILSELIWSDLETYQLALNGQLVANRLFFSKTKLRWEFGYGWIVSGDNQDSDYLGDNRTGEFSRSNNNSDDGSMIDVTIGAGPLFYSASKKYSLAILLGYSYHEQNLTMTDGFQTIPATGPFADLNSKYETQWWGPWFGLDLEVVPTNNVSIASFFEFHLAEYQAKADWNLRVDLAHPVSFEHWGDGDFGISDGYGIVAGLGVKFNLSPKWSLNLDGKYQQWNIKDGIDQIYFSDGTVGGTRLNEVNWNSFSGMVGIVYRY